MAIGNIFGKNIGDAMSPGLNSRYNKSPNAVSPKGGKSKSNRSGANPGTPKGPSGGPPPGSNIRFRGSAGG